MPTKYKGTPSQVLALDTFIKLNRAVNSFNSRLNQHGTQGNLSPSQFAVMEALLHLGPMCQTDLSQKLLLSTGNITMVIDNLVRHGLVTRERNTDDRRFITISLTPAGKTLISSIFPSHVNAIAEEMSVLNEREQRQLGALCKKLGMRNPK
jgi:MarR family transcriptional regulator, 2-MHQ and catechol-resistance regulon repressor